MHPLTVTEARDQLTSTIRSYRDQAGDHEPVIFGSHRRAEAVILPFQTYEELLDRKQVGGLREAILSRRELIRRLANLNQISEVSLFGSVARGEETLESDIDFLVTPMPRATFFDLAQFQIDMEQFFQRRVDVVSRGALDPIRDQEILAEAILI